MGKKTRKTRWRTLNIDERSDSEESTIAPSQIPKVFQHKSYSYSKFSYSSQSTPTRRYPSDVKSTRSSSTASETKVTFNEDEYTRITTPRQDVLFKKGYLSKPKTYQTQTSTGTSTNSTGNSTGNGTPEHQSADGAEGTDLEYESQFVFPNGFVDQNGVYYINSFEPYPVVLYNTAICYPEFPSSRPKRHSTSSMTESMSPNNEETSQSGGEIANNVPEFPQVYNVLCPGYYYNGNCSTEETVSSGQSPSEGRRMKKKRRRKSSTTKDQEENTSDNTEEEEDEKTVTENDRLVSVPPADSMEKSRTNEATEENKTDVEPRLEVVEEPKAPEAIVTPVNGEASSEHKDCNQPLNEMPPCVQNSCDQQTCDSKDEAENPKSPPETPKFDLKPDAQEFVPRAYRQPPPLPIDPNLQFIQPNFVPVPLMSPMGEIVAPPSFPPPFLPPGIPINLMPPPNFVNFVPSPKFTPKIAEEAVSEDLRAENVEEKVHSVTPIEVQKVPKVNNRNDIDIEKIVSKLEEAAREQRFKDNKTRNGKNNYHRGRYQNGDQDNQDFSYKQRYNRQNGYARFNRKRLEKNEPKVEDDQSKKGVLEKSTSSKEAASVIEEQPSRIEPEEVRKSSVKEARIPINKPVDNIQIKPKIVKKYSDNLRKPQNGVNTPKKCPRFEKHTTDNVISPKQSETPKKVKENVLEKPQKSVTQWISVSSRKKRKNKSADDADALSEPEVHEEAHQDDMFESYDVDLLVDVVTPSKAVEVQEQQIEIKEELIEVIQPAVEKVVVEEKKVEVKESGRRSKKNTQKPLVKRLLIQDTYPEEENNEIEAKEEIKSNPVEPEIITAPSVEPITATITDKKSKKKRKKPSKQTQSISSSSTTINNLDDSYDFLLENSLLDDSEEKTNVEISQELDRMIQKGLYNNLEEKIKSLNIGVANDSFFRSLQISSIPTPSLTEKNSYFKTCDFNSVLKNVTKLQDPQPSTSKSGIFLENPKVNEILKDVCHDLPRIDVPEVVVQKTTKKSNGKLKNKSKKSPVMEVVKVDEVEKAKNETELVVAVEATKDVEEMKILPVEDVGEKLYPITQAVKEWMTKTRENTPEIEILKSPSTIFKEFCEVDKEELEEEVTVFEKENKEDVLEEVDLLECWDNDLSVSNIVEEKEEEKVLTNGTVRKGSVEEGEDVLEVYESKYGKNEDFLKLQKEVQEKKASSNINRNTNLPYRAICCSVM